MSIKLYKKNTFINVNKWQKAHHVKYIIHVLYFSLKLYDFYHKLRFFFNERLVPAGFALEAFTLVAKLNTWCDCAIKSVGEINIIIQSTSS